MTIPKRDYPAKPEAVYFYGTCLSDLFYSQSGLAAVEMLEQEGVRVIYPPDQTCCGQPPFNSGYREEARQVARNQMALFPKDIPVVVPSGSCGGMMAVHYPELFAEAPAPEKTQAEQFAARVFEWSDFMANVLKASLVDQGPAVKVAYHPSCHLQREMNVRDAPLNLLGQLAQVEMVTLERADECCGFGGTFSVKQEAISGAMVGDKQASIVASGAEILVSMDSGCLMNIGGALSKAGHNLRVMPLPLFLKERVNGSTSSTKAKGGE